MLLCTETFRRPFVHLIFHFQDVLLGQFQFFFLFHAITFELNLSCNAMILQHFLFAHSFFWVWRVFRRHAQDRDRRENRNRAQPFECAITWRRRIVWNVVSHKFGINRVHLRNSAEYSFQSHVCIFTHNNKKLHARPTTSPNEILILWLRAKSTFCTHTQASSTFDLMQ